MSSWTLNIQILIPSGVLWFSHHFYLEKDNILSRLQQLMVAEQYQYLQYIKSIFSSTVHHLGDVLVGFLA